MLTGTAQMVVGAIGVAKDRSVLWFGTQCDQAQLAPDIVVASQVYHWEVALSRAHRRHRGRHARRVDVRHQPRQRRRGDRVQPRLRTCPPIVRSAADELIAGLRRAAQTGVSGDAPSGLGAGGHRGRRRHDVDRDAGDAAAARCAASPRRFPGVVANDSVDFDVRRRRGARAASARTAPASPR